MQGWIKLHRKIRSNPIFNDLQLYRLATICMTEAYHKEVDQPLGNQVVKVLPGQFPTGRFDLHEMYNRGLKPKEKASEKTVWRWLQKLEKLDFLTINSTNKYSIVTVLNWDLYQSVDHQNDQQMTNKRPADDQQMTTNKNVKNVKNVKNDKEEKTIQQIKDLRSAYSKELIPIIDDYWKMMKKTRKSNVIQYSVILKTMEKWKKFDEVVIKYALKKHLDMYDDEDKKETYTLGIMRNTSPGEASDLLDKRPTKKKVESFDEYKQEKKVTSKVNGSLFD